VFGETYPDPVRVVAVGQPVSDLIDGPSNPAWNELSVEFCGGTHVASTAMINAFAITGEEAVAKGVRRIVAITGDLAAYAIKTADGMQGQVAAAAKMSDLELSKAIAPLAAELEAHTLPAWRKFRMRAEIAKLTERVKAASKAMSGAVRDEAVRQARMIADNASNANELVVVATIEAGDDRQALQAAVKTVRDKCPRVAVMLFTVDQAGDKVAMFAAVPEGLVQKGLKAGDWVRDAAAAVGGKGGGKPDSAQGGGTDVAKVHEAVAGARRAALKIVM